MARNIEIKARIESLDALEPKVARLADSGPSEILHDDTFFRCETVRRADFQEPEGPDRVGSTNSPDEKAVVQSASRLNGW